MPEVVIDSREPQHLYEIAQKHLKDVPVIRKKLELGDIEYYSVIIERKTPNDFLTSVRRHSFWSNLYLMKRFYNHPILYLDGDTDDWMRALSRRGIHYAMIQGSVASVCLMSIPIVSFSKPESAFKWFNFLFKKVTDKHKPSTASLEFAKKEASLHELRVRSIMAVPRIGNVKAEELLKKYKSIYNIIKESERRDNPLQEAIYKFYCEEE